MTLSFFQNLPLLFRHWRLQQRIGYRFKDITLLDVALTHASMEVANNERLEFLGDAVLDLVVSEILFKKYAEVDEGTLTQMKIMSVNNAHLLSVALNLGITDVLEMGKGLYQSESRGTKMFADAVEALIGAIYLDGGLRPAHKFIDKYVMQTLPTLQETKVHPKTALQNWLKKQGFEYPEYSVTQDATQSGDSLWYVKCTIKNLAITRTGRAETRKAAETEAAIEILGALGVMSNGS
ncbi:MAG: ribonuclease III [Gammaproteobacteria bacterium]|nr:ribonuclease III [Gammaproteobacteria bacterium]